jgi:predicted ribosomally synthesized peptide with nif11-like leader
MKIDVVKAFRQKVAEDTSLRKALAKLEGEDVAGLTEIAKRAGFDFNVEEYRTVAAATGADWRRWITGHQSFSGQLSEADLSSIAGGLRTDDPKTPVCNSPPTNDPLWCC